MASVQSSDRFYYYRVTGVYKNGKASELKCNCPWAQAGHNCKHMAAVLLEIKQNEALLRISVVINSNANLFTSS
ncbi:SWIM zinc finger family protein [Clostridium sp.]|uniref:SWIM zinc finger family protein n=1 Tax=Clostridium sp. TaxID=1506 RepID=UPI0035A1A19B